ncbi:MAG: UDP-N-acetylmuramoyl-L-alanine--D-glutamate ligase [Nitrospirales bacterium]
MIQNLDGQSVTVVGMGKSGIAAARLLREVGAQVIIVDEQEREALQPALSMLVEESIESVTGARWASAFHDADCIVVSPGVPTDHPALMTARRQGTPVIGEMELACWYLDIPIIAVTGTNGKSTTVRLIGEFLQAGGKHPFVGGNLGIPLCEGVLAHRAAGRGHSTEHVPYDYAIVEASSFQLETIEHFRPWIAVILNITPDHLDRHPSFEQYQEAKWKMFRNQTAEDIAVINVDDPLIAAKADSLPSSVVGFSLKLPLPVGVWLEEATVKARIAEVECLVAERQQIALRGNHNLANVLAATAVGLLCDCSLDSIRHVVGSFLGTEHVLEFVREYHGVKYYNDSKGTNVDATQKAMASFDEPLLLIVGGKDKGGDFTKLHELIQKKVTTVIAIGEAASRIVSSLKQVMTPIVAHDLQEAITTAAREARNGDVVLFSPACSSFDMFKNYDHRGKEFKRCVHQLGE